MAQLPEWLTRAIILASLGWLAMTVQDNVRTVTAVNAKVNMLVRFMLPEQTKVEVAR